MLARIPCKKELIGLKHTRAKWWRLFWLRADAKCRLPPSDQVRSRRRGDSRTVDVEGAQACCFGGICSFGLILKWASLGGDAKRGHIRKLLGDFVCLSYGVYCSMFNVKSTSAIQQA